MTEDISDKTSAQVDTILTVAVPIEKSYCLLQNMFTGADIDLQFYKTGSWQTARSIFCSFFCSLGGVPNISARENGASKNTIERAKVRTTRDKHRKICSMRLA